MTPLVVVVLVAQTLKEGDSWSLRKCVRIRTAVLLQTAVSRDGSEGSRLAAPLVRCRLLAVFSSCGRNQIAKRKAYMLRVTYCVVWMRRRIASKN